MDHVREAHNVPGEIRKISLETLFPPWTVTRQVYTESLTSRHSGISNGRDAVQRHLVVAGSPLWSAQEGSSARRVSHKLFVAAGALSYRCLRPCRPREGRPTLPARLCHVRQNLRLLCVPRLDHPDARLVTGGQYGSWSRPYGSLLDSQCRTHWLRRGRWCLIVVHHWCQYQWILLVWTYRRFGLQPCLLRLTPSLPNVSSHSGGGGGICFA